MPVGKSDLKALAAFKPGSGGGARNFLQPTPGSKLRLRICPPYTDGPPMLIDGRNVPFLGMRLHYLDQGDDERGVSGVCPGDGCFSCEVYWAVVSRIPKEETDLKEAIRAIKPNDRTYSNVVDRDAERILVWSAPWGVASNVATHFNTYADDGVDLSDPVKGHDLVIPVNKRGRSYVFGNVSIAPRATKLGIPGWEDELHDLDAVARQRELSLEAVREAVPGALGDFHDAIMALFEAAPKGKTHRKAEAPAAGKGRKTKKRRTAKKATDKKATSKKATSKKATGKKATSTKQTTRGRRV